MPHAEVGVQNDPIHAIVAAAQEILIQSAQPICHGGYARRTPAYFKLPRRGHFFAARSAKKRSLFERALALDPGSIEAQGWLAGMLVNRVLDLMTDTEAADIERAGRVLGQR